MSNYPIEGWITPARPLDAAEQADRIKQEHAELVEALHLAIKIIPRAWMPAAPVTYAEWDAAFEKIEAILEKVKQ